MRGRGDSTNQNLDSLLDTMANVVGILIVVMAVTQITVGQAVKRIRFLESSDAASIAEERSREQEKRSLVSQLEELERRWQRLEPTASRAPGQSAALREHLSRLESHDIARETRQAQESLLVSSVAGDRDALLGLEGEVSQQREALAARRLRLRQAAEERSRGPFEVRMPDPRPAPPGAVEYVLFCRYGRVIPVDMEGLLDVMNEALPRGFGSRTPRPAELAQIVRDFGSRLVGDADFRWSVFDRGVYGLAARLSWRDAESGESAGWIEHPESRFRQTLRSVSPRGRFLQFHVWSDSFEVYLAARKLAEKRGFAVGWQAYDEREEYEGVLTRHKRDDPVPID
ncbi:MAG: hypothetical protein JRG96_08085 [Deltaproteobacteria bacterium]|nr:hypothetical protein [Deltaproteobacteria bacterium]MBW2419326.1 hypothetical protein [Deltaproteobacteria bacterium]